ncbi:MAG TPA: hypothetical protein VIL44_11310 [Micromonospora sp.]
MKRLLWLGVGLAIGALVVRKLSQAAHAYSPAGIAASLSESAGRLTESVRTFIDDVREGMAEREREIHAAFAEGIALDDQTVESGEETGSDEQTQSREGIR